MSFVIIAVVAGSLQAVSQINTAKAQKIELDKQAEQEKIAAKGRELQRRERLNKLLSANIVGMSTSGISGEGTPESIALKNAQTASLSEGLATLSDKLKQAQLRRQGSNLAAAGRVQAASTLLNTTISAAALKPGTPPKAGGG